MAEKIRAGGSGIPAFYSPTGIGTDLEYGTMAVKYSRDGKTVLKHSQPRESRFFNGKKYLLEEAITGDFAFVKCWKADKAGNLVFRKTARNFNPDIAAAAKIVIAEAEEIVEIGELDPDEIHCPGIFIDRVVHGYNYLKPIEKLTLLQNGCVRVAAKNDAERVKRIMIARRAAAEIKRNMIVNLGLGMPVVTANFVDPSLNV